MLQRKGIRPALILAIWDPTDPDPSSTLQTHEYIHILAARCNFYAPTLIDPPIFEYSKILELDRFKGSDSSSDSKQVTIVAPILPLKYVREGKRTRIFLVHIPVPLSVISAHAQVIRRVYMGKPFQRIY